jgi:hypothetical protein
MSTTPVVDGQIVVAEPDVRLGSLPIQSAKDLVERGTELAKALADVIEQQKLFVVISQRKYVKVEGWLTLGAMLGVVPVEEYLHRLPENEGFEAKINLIRAKDGGIVGSASAECTFKERTWKTRDSYSLRSMAITRATGKAFRLSFGWIMKLANYEATPAEEMFDTSEGSEEASQKVAKDKIAAANATVPALFYVEHKESQLYEITGAASLLQAFKWRLESVRQKAIKGIFVDGETLENLKYEFQKANVEFRPLKAA